MASQSPECSRLQDEQTHFLLKASGDEVFLLTGPWVAWPLRIHRQSFHPVFPDLGWAQSVLLGGKPQDTSSDLQERFSKVRKKTLTFPLVLTAANTVEEYGAQATSPTAEFRS